MEGLGRFVRSTLVTPRGSTGDDLTADERIRAIDDHMATTEVMTWSVVAGAAIVGGRSFLSLVRATPSTPPSTLVTRATVCTWSLVAIALGKLWHAQEQHHAVEMKELIRLDASRA